MATTISCVDKQQPFKATLAAGGPPAIGMGQPVTFTRHAASVSNLPSVVELCADGAQPDAVVGRIPVSETSPGDIHLIGSPGAPARLGGAVKKGQALVVKGGLFEAGAAASGNKAPFCAAVDGASGDTIATCPHTKVL